jgi:hypothetical protein
MVWIRPCVTGDLLGRFRDMWHQSTAPSDDRRSTKLRTLTHEELVLAVDELVSLVAIVAVTAAQASGDTHLATVADLDWTRHGRTAVRSASGPAKAIA